MIMPRIRLIWGEMIVHYLDDKVMSYIEYSNHFLLPAKPDMTDQEREMAANIVASQFQKLCIWHDADSIEHVVYPTMLN